MEPASKRQKIDESPLQSILNRLIHGNQSYVKKSISSLPTPSYLIDLQILKRNVEQMRQRAKSLGVSLRPHVKTHKTIEAALLQLYGDEISTIDVEKVRSTAKITVSTLGEARFFAAHDFQDILYAVPIVKAKLDAAAALTRQIRKFCVLVDSEYGAKDLIEYQKENNDIIFHVYVDIDSGYHRTGFDPSSDSVFNAIKTMKEANIDIVGLYTHGGDSYHANGSAEASKYAERETKVIVDFAAELKKRLQLDMDVVAVGSTPTCSNPPAGSANSWGIGATEIHPGNYVFYDVTQASIGSCSLENNASFVLARVISKYANPKRLMLDAGALALSKDQGATHMRSADTPQTWGKILGHPEMHLTRITQELGVVEGDFDFEGSVTVNDVVKIMPNHSCLAAACFPKYYIVDSDGKTVIDEWTTCPRDW